MKFRDLIRVLEKKGWRVVRQRGSHRQYKNTLKPGVVTIACHQLSDEIAPGTLGSILKQAGLNRSDL
jgi:predicted RNA binding protein YcfA (HicA-like mRNA interferase family)